MTGAEFSLLRDAWLPVRRADHSPDRIRPADLTAKLSHNPVVALDWPRPDLRIACLEFLIGLLCTAFPPEDGEAWRDAWRKPPDPAELDAAFAPFAAAFVLDGDGPRFLQDQEELPEGTVPIERLLINTPGENTVKKNTDLLVKRDRFAALGRPAAAMALFALQAFAPAGGAGHRVSLRGGGPLTTLVLPGRRDANEPLSLWHMLWANVLLGDKPRPAELPLVFPWLAPTRRSDAGGAGTPLDGKLAHRLQAFWGMPRRIRLEFFAAGPGEVCDLTGRRDDVLVHGFRTRPGGVQYLSAVREHPLTPCYRTKPTDPWLALHPQPGGIGFRHWHGLVTANEAGGTLPAHVVPTFNERRGSVEPLARREARLLAAGYDMDNMKARGFVEAEMPLFVLDDGQARKSLLDHAARLAQAATQAGRLLANAVRIALADRANTDAAFLDAVRTSFFEATAAPFWQALQAARDRLEGGEELDIEAAGKAWLDALRREALALFDEAAPLDPLDPRSAGRLKEGAWHPPPVVEARRWLGINLAGYGPEGQKLWLVLHLEKPQPSKRKKAKA
jgi:CRISPR system Cascade subunit CasA